MTVVDVINFVIWEDRKLKKKKDLPHPVSSQLNNSTSKGRYIKLYYPEVTL